MRAGGSIQAYAHGGDSDGGHRDDCEGESELRRTRRAETKRGSRRLSFGKIDELRRVTKCVRRIESPFRGEFAIPTDFTSVKVKQASKQARPDPFLPRWLHVQGYSVALALV